GFSTSWGIGPDNIFGRSSALSRRTESDDEEALRWAALEKLPTLDRLHTTILQKQVSGRIIHEEVDVRRMGFVERQQIIDRLLKVTEEDNDRFLKKLRARIDRVAIKLPTIEVRYENLTVCATCFFGGRTLPILRNSTLNFLEAALDATGLTKTRKTTLNILHGISGIIKPARMTLLLGPPGSGKTTLLLALAGKLNSDLKAMGKIAYNGHTLDEFVPQKTAVYISQNDLHVGEMTVRETLDFSARCQGAGTRHDMLVELARREKEAGIYPEHDVDVYMKAIAVEGQEHNLLTDYIMKILGLDVCANTMVGDSMHRGISGGQRKRVTTGEMLVGPTDALFMDEISTGLDSSTTYQIVKCIRQLCHVMESTIFMSLLQPAPETFELFDDVVLLSEGLVVYHGPCEHVLEFFEGCGFQCPERKGIADFLQEVTSIKDQEQYWHDKSRPYTFVSVKQFSDHFKSFHVGQKLVQELAVPFDKQQSHKAALKLDKYSVGRYELFKSNFAKEWLLMKRNSFVYVFKTIQIGIVGLISMSVFFRSTLSQNSEEDGLHYMGAIFFGNVIIMFNGYAELSLTLDRLPVFYKQRDLMFFPAWAYALPTLVLSLPSSIVEAGIYSILTYYEIGYAPGVVRFFKYYLTLFLVHQMAGAMFRMIAGIFRTMVLAATGGTFLLLIIFMLGGFILPRSEIHPWWIWGYWISPLNYAQSSLSVNEFLAPRWSKPVDGTMHTLGRAILEKRGMIAHNYYYWVGVGALVVSTFLFNIVYSITLSYLSPLEQSQATISEEALAEKQANLLGTKPLLSGRNSSKSRSRTKDPTVASKSVKKGMILPFRPLSISFDSIRYYVDMPAEMMSQTTETRLQLLHGITGAFRPGVLTALVGVSGAGKTTLMDVLAGRKTGGYIKGDIRISGYLKKQKTFARIAGYCEQNDIHSPQMTVRESLVFSAWLRLPADINNEMREQFVDEVIDLVELNSLESALVGLPGVTGLSTEQRKRLTIAVELVANPSIIFMDEPTSGLDARAAAIVMRTVRNIVDTGRTAVCTIHQPSIDIFEAFDEMLLLKRGGRTIYMGPLGRHSRELVDYFEAIPGVQKIKEGVNPATWMLEASSVSVETQLGIDFAEIYAESSLCQRNKALVQQLSTPEPGTEDLYYPTQYSQPFVVQVRACFWKQWVTYWRSESYNMARFVFAITSAILFGTIFWNMGKETSDAVSLLSLMGSIYGAALFIGVNNASGVQPVVAIERTIFYRERAAGMYSAFPYAIAQVLIETPYCFVQTIMYALITFSMIGFKWGFMKFFWYTYVMFFTLLYFTYYGMMAVSLTPNHQVAAIMASGFYSIFNLFSGFVVFKPDIPKWWSWYYWICPTAWTLYGEILTQFSDVTSPVLPIGVIDVPENYIPMRQFLKMKFGFERDMQGLVLAMPVVFTVLFALVFALAIKYLNFQQR
uniref:ABC transporter domain-containing protein n=1 Tax=Physcomitrium patens TaxID=3218 RepID=A0A7I4DSN0_PHYPA